ncbi:MAG: hypothetical protein LBP53_04550 [Candidatus Peribacteria bacterium]|jgi:hypothetical protein|nr:hypothetical protein [Candidatus Peribacteria bacterium]
MLYQEINITSGTQTYFPHYFYGGENTLNDLTWKSEGLRIREITDKNADLYFFFDVPTSLVETKQFSLGLTSGATLS